MYNGLKTYKLNVENLTKVRKTFVLQLWPPTNMRELTCAQASGAWLKSRRAYNVCELSHAAWLNSRRGIFENNVGREQNVPGEKQKSNLRVPLIVSKPSIYHGTSNWKWISLKNCENKILCSTISYPWRFYKPWKPILKN